MNHKAFVNISLYYMEVAMNNQNPFTYEKEIPQKPQQIPLYIEQLPPVIPPPPKEENEESGVIIIQL
jgi:hypothetical protein